MENRINVAELLKDCPTGMELNCLMYDNLYFKCIREHAIYPIVCYTIDSKGEKEEITFNWYGKYALTDTAKCVIFPKGKTTWEGFHRPFEDGDVAASDSGLWLGIIKNKYNTDNTEYYTTHCALDGTFYYKFLTKGEYCFSRFATEEEKAKLFDAIKANGYKWNAETKTLEKLIEPRFKVGDRIRHKEETKWTCVIRRIDDRYWVDEHPTCYTLPFGKQDEYELVPNKFDINTLIPFESKVLVRHNKDNKWTGSFFSFIDRDFHSYCYKFITTAGKSYPMMIPYKGNEHLLGKAEDCNEYYKIWENDNR